MTLSNWTSWPSWFRLGPISRISLGLVVLILCLVQVADMFLGVVPARGELERRVHQRVAENLAMQITALLEAGDTAMLGKTIQQVLARDAEMLSVSVKRSDGTVLLQRGTQRQSPAVTGMPPVNTSPVRVPIFSGRQPWGEISIQFAAIESTTFKAWLAQPSVQLMAVLGLGGFLLCYAYLRRAMHYLNPTASVPDRVRKAFDSLTEGLLIIDQKARIVLANRAFRQLHPRANDELNGQAIASLDWLGKSESGSAWTQTLASGTAIEAQALLILAPDGTQTQLLVSSAPISDNKGRARGSLITFNNVTAIHKTNTALRNTLELIQKFQIEIEQKNVELQRLASRDGLTGIYNRRAFFELGEALFAQARQKHSQLCCVMADIDHFKQFNDKYGHGVGDQVIQVVSRSMQAGLRQSDVLGRYGGEEFCIVLPETALEMALDVAERVRSDIELNAYSAIRDIDVMPIRASFGVSVLDASTASLKDLIDQADQALYKSKQAGRNRVSVWQRDANPTSNS